MRLQADERSILASFQSGPQAEAAVGALRRAGFTEIQLDRVGSFGLEQAVDEQRPALAGDEGSLARTVLGPGQIDSNAAVLLDASTTVSGMSGAPTDLVPPFLVTAVVAQQRADEAVRLLEEYGGRV